MIDHVSVAVADLERAARFFAAALAPLGFAVLREGETTVGFGKRYPEFWINLRPAARPPSDGIHVALRAASTAEVDAFHAAALANGGTCDGPPGLRPQYRDGYYAAFVRDLDGNRIEAVTFLAGGR